MMTAYVSSKEIHILRNSALKAQSSFMNNNKNLLPFTLSKKKSVNKENVNQKRDKSLIFSNIPEEDIVTTDQHTNSAKSNIRPTQLSLKFKNVMTKELPESGFNSINFDEFSDSFPEFIGRTSVCSTPMTENKILHGNLLSICSNTNEELEGVDIKEDIRPSLSMLSNEFVVASVQPSIDQKIKKVRKIIGTPRKLRLATKITETICFDFELNKELQHANNKPNLKGSKLPIDSFNYMQNPYKSQRRRNSWGTLNKIKKKLKNGKNSSGKTTKTLIFHEAQRVDWGSDTEFIDDCETKPSRSITDPTFPVFNSTGDPISKCLFEEFLEFYYTKLCSGIKKPKQKYIKEQDFRVIEQLNVKSRTDNATDKILLKGSSKLNKKYLSLPLKSCTQTSESGPDFRSRGLQLTPLMAKLTLLALDNEHEIGFAESYDLTSNSNDPTSLVTKGRSSLLRSDFDVTSGLEVNESLEKIDLFVCGQQNMTLVMLLEDGAAQKQKLIENLFEICVSKLTKIESQLLQVLNMHVEGVEKGGEGNYSFIAIENKKWDTVQKIGPWSPNELNIVQLMHHDMKRQTSFTDMILRREENILYGYQCGNVNIFYQQSHNSSTGIPPPSDVFGNVCSVSRRRLERDHAIVLL